MCKSLIIVQAWFEHMLLVDFQMCEKLGFVPQQSTVQINLHDTRQEHLNSTVIGFQAPSVSRCTFVGGLSSVRALTDPAGARLR